MNKNKQIRGLLKQAIAERDASIYYGFLDKKSRARKRIRKQQKNSRRYNRVNR